MRLIPFFSFAYLLEVSPRIRESGGTGDEARTRKNLQSGNLAFYQLNYTRIFWTLPSGFMWSAINHSATTLQPKVRTDSICPTYSVHPYEKIGFHFSPKGLSGALAMLNRGAIRQLCVDVFVKDLS